ncbi:MAG: hypothetical protein ACJ74D_09300 [Gaiellaceae bacterium]
MRPRTFAALALALLTLLVGVPSASATDPFPTLGIATLSSDHFTVHYNRDDSHTACENFITQERAGEVLGMLERARSFSAGLGGGFAPPIEDVDAKVHVSIDDLNNVCVPYGAIPFGTPLPIERWDAVLEPIAVAGARNIHLNTIKSGLTYRVIAHEVFHLVEDAIAPGADPWLHEATAEWGAARATQAAGDVVASSGTTLDCVGSECGDTDAEKNGYPGWMLIQYLAERYGDSKVKDLWTQAGANPGVLATTDLAAILPVSLATFYNDFASARLTGAFTFVPLAGVLPSPKATITTGTTTATSDTAVVAVNHLAAQYLTFTHADNDGACFEATMKLNVTIPAGVESHPAYWPGTIGSVAQPLTVAGSSATLSVPWNTCGTSPDAYLSLPNDSLGLDGREFAVTVSLQVDFGKPASPTAPPPGVHVIGTVVPAPMGDPAPTLKIYAPEVLRVSTQTRLLRFVVFSSGDGKLQATLGASSLGSAALRSGNNDVRFVLPPQLFKSLRTKSVSNLLLLTSQSPTGAKGATFTRKVVVQTPPKPKRKKPKKKH